MIRDIYNRNPQDPNYVYGILEHSDPIESIISKIKILLGTSQGQILGDLNCGIGIEELIFETRINKIELEEKIKSQISQYITESADYKVEPVVSFGRGDGTDYCIIDIYINDSRVVGVRII